ncbi:uncharacterized protein LOC133183344 [Saccostrea echinata]|uniref:uncharacterized protein LOC133183344 n=1 Tax=Saccostrea echinata TaxID=191078 RepID=UPI002A80427A|nr:uncharacterized protein LOC133183344 [Saccostrea echinata]
MFTLICAVALVASAFADYGSSHKNKHAVYNTVPYNTVGLGTTGVLGSVQTPFPYMGVNQGLAGLQGNLMNQFPYQTFQGYQNLQGYMAQPYLTQGVGLNQGVFPGNLNYGDDDYFNRLQYMSMFQPNFNQYSSYGPYMNNYRYNNVGGYGRRRSVY